MHLEQFFRTQYNPTPIKTHYKHYLPLPHFQNKPICQIRLFTGIDQKKKKRKVPKEKAQKRGNMKINHI